MRIKLASLGANRTLRQETCCWCQQGFCRHPSSYSSCTGLHLCALLADGCSYFIALWSCRRREKMRQKTTHTHMHFRSAYFIMWGSRRMSNVARLYIAFIRNPLVCLLQATAGSGMGYRLVKSLCTYHYYPMWLKAFHGKIPHSTKPVHNAFQPGFLQTCYCSH